MNEWISAVSQGQLEIMRLTLAKFIYDCEMALGSIAPYATITQIQQAWDLSHIVDKEMAQRVREYQITPGKPGTPD